MEASSFYTNFEYSLYCKKSFVLNHAQSSVNQEIYNLSSVNQEIYDDLYNVLDNNIISYDDYHKYYGMNKCIIDIANNIKKQLQ